MFRCCLSCPAQGLLFFVLHWSSFLLDIVHELKFSLEQQMGKDHLGWEFLSSGIAVFCASFIIFFVRKQGWSAGWECVDTPFPFATTVFQNKMYCTVMTKISAYSYQYQKAAVNKWTIHAYNPGNVRREALPKATVWYSTPALCNAKERRQGWGRSRIRSVALFIPRATPAGHLGAHESCHGHVCVLSEPRSEATAQACQTHCQKALKWLGLF